MDLKREGTDNKGLITVEVSASWDQDYLSLGKSRPRLVKICENWENIWNIAGTWDLTSKTFIPGLANNGINTKEFWLN